MVFLEKIGLDFYLLISEEFGFGFHFSVGGRRGCVSQSEAKTSVLNFDKKHLGV